MRQFRCVRYMVGIAWLGAHWELVEHVKYMLEYKITTPKGVKFHGTESTAPNSIVMNALNFYGGTFRFRNVPTTNYHE